MTVAGKDSYQYRWDSRKKNINSVCILWGFFSLCKTQKKNRQGMFICEKIVLVHIAKYHRKYITKDPCDHNENTLRCVCVCEAMAHK